MFQVNTARTSTALTFFSARLPLPPGLNHLEREIHRPRVASQQARFRHFHAEAYRSLAAATSFYDFGTIVQLRESPFHIPLSAYIKFFYAYTWNVDQIGQEQAIIETTLRYLDLREHPVVELHVQKFVDEQDPHAEIFLSCAPQRK